MALKNKWEMQRCCIVSAFYVRRDVKKFENLMIRLMLLDNKSRIIREEEIKDLPLKCVELY